MSKEKIENTNSESKTETAEQPKESYSIYEYLKNNTSILISVISALVAIAAAVLKLGYYLYHTAYLNYWNIDSKLISTTETYWLEDIALSFALLFIGIAFVGLINETSGTFKKCRYFIKCIKKLIKNQKKEINNLKKEKNLLSESKKNHKRIKEILGSLNIKTSKYEKLKKEKTKIKIIAWGQFLVHLFLYALAFGAVFYIFSLKYSVSQNGSLITILITVISLELLTAVFGYITTPINKKAIEEKCIELLNENNVHNIHCELPMFLISKIGTFGVKHYLSNKYIFRISIFMIIFFTGFLFAVSDQGKKDALSFKSNFLITTINNTDYAIIATDSDNIIAERIEVNGKDATIYVNEQIIISKENIEMNVCTFDNISKKSN